MAGKILKVVMNAHIMAGNTGGYEKLASEVCKARYDFKQLKPTKDATYYCMKKTGSCDGRDTLMIMAGNVKAMLWRKTTD